MLGFSFSSSSVTGFKFFQDRQQNPAVSNIYHLHQGGQRYLSFPVKKNDYAVITKLMMNANEKNENRASPNEQDNAQLYSSLDAKVKELFGDATKDEILNSASTLTENETVYTWDPSQPQQRRRAMKKEQNKRVMSLETVAILSVVIGIIFTGMYFVGAVHTAQVPNFEDRKATQNSQPPERQQPTYGTKTYIDPYKLLDDEARMYSMTPYRAQGAEQSQQN